MMRMQLAAAAAALLLACSASAALAQSATSGGGGGSTPAPASNVLSGTTVTAAELTGSAPASVAATLSAASGGVILAGNVGIVFPAGAFAGLSGNVSVTITANPAALANINAGGPTQFSPNGTILDIDVRDANGVHITTFPAAVTIVFKPNPADLAMAGGDFSLLTGAYVIDADSPEAENPNHFPINTLVLIPPSAITVDPVSGTFTAVLHFIGSVVGVVANPVGYVETVNPDANLYSSFDPNTSQTFGGVGQFAPLQVVEPQIGTRLLVLDPDTNNYSYVNATDVGPAGPPPARSSSAVVRGLLTP